MKLNKNLRIGIIGLGVGAHHIAAYVKNKYCDVISVCDLDNKKILKFKKKYPNAKFTNYANDIINDQSIDVISIASFDNYRFDQLISSIKNKKHIFIEKPLCLNEKELSKIVQLQKMHPNCIISSNMVLRANPRFQYLKNKYKEGLFKNTHYIEASYFWGRFEKLSGWRANIDHYSIILGASIHLIDLVLWILKDKPIYVETFGNRIGANNKMIKNNTFVSTNLVFENSLVVTINAHGLSVHPHFHSFKLFSQEISFIQELNNAFFIKKNNLNKLIKVKHPYPHKENRGLIIDNFINKIRKRSLKSEYVSFNEICDSMSICLSAIKSNKLRKKIKIKYY